MNNPSEQSQLCHCNLLLTVLRLERANGFRHYDVHGCELCTEDDIVRALERDHAIQKIPPAGLDELHPSHIEGPRLPDDRRAA